VKRKRTNPISPGTLFINEGVLLTQEAVMGMDSDSGPFKKQELDDLDDQQDKIIKKIREKERPGFLKRIIALLQYFFKPDQIL
jgi:hypothetical protein